MSRLPVPIPLDYADPLDVDSSFLCHVNAGRKRLSLIKSCRLMELVQGDPRVSGLTLLHLRPELKQARKWLCPEGELYDRSGDSRKGSQGYHPDA